MVALFYAAKEAQSLDSPLYEHIKALHEAGSANLPSRRSISHIIFPSSNSAIEFPIKYSTRQLPSSGKTKRRPSAWAEHHVEPEVSRAERWAPRQLGMGDMLVVREPRVRTVLYILPPNSA